MPEASKNVPGSCAIRGWASSVTEMSLRSAFSTEMPIRWPASRSISSPDSVTSPKSPAPGIDVAASVDWLGSAVEVASSLVSDVAVDSDADSAASVVMAPTRNTGSLAASAVLFAPLRVALGSSLDGVHAVSRASAERAAMAPWIFVDNRETSLKHRDENCE